MADVQGSPHWRPIKEDDAELVLKSGIIFGLPNLKKSPLTTYGQKRFNKTLVLANSWVEKAKENVNFGEVVAEDVETYLYSIKDKKIKRRSGSPLYDTFLEWCETHAGAVAIGLFCVISPAARRLAEAYGTKIEKLESEDQPDLFNIPDVIDDLEDRISGLEEIAEAVDAFADATSWQDLVDILEVLPDGIGPAPMEKKRAIGDNIGPNSDDTKAVSKRACGE